MYEDLCTRCSFHLKKIKRWNNTEQNISTKPLTLRAARESLLCLLSCLLRVYSKFTCRGFQSQGFSSWCERHSYG